MKYLTKNSIRLFRGQNVNGIRSKSIWYGNSKVGVKGIHGTVLRSDSTRRSLDSIGSE
jgi:hypothetical protein